MDKEGTVITLHSPCMALWSLVEQCGCTHAQAKVEQEEHVERHVDLQCVVLVEVVAGLNSTAE